MKFLCNRQQEVLSNSGVIPVNSMMYIPAIVTAVYFKHDDIEAVLAENEFVFVDAELFEDVFFVIVLQNYPDSVTLQRLVNMYERTLISALPYKTAEWIAWELLESTFQGYDETQLSVVDCPSLKLNGEDNFINLGEYANYTDNFTIFFKSKLNSSGCIFSRRDLDIAQYYIFVNVSGYLLFYNDNQNIASGLSVLDDEYHDCAFVINGDSSFIYIDGVKRISFNADLPQSDTDTIVGAYNQGYNGLIECSMLFLGVVKRSMTVDELDKLFTFNSEYLPEETESFIPFFNFSGKYIYDAITGKRYLIQGTKDDIWTEKQNVAVSDHLRRGYSRYSQGNGLGYYDTGVLVAPGLELEIGVFIDNVETPVFSALMMEMEEQDSQSQFRQGNG